MNYYADVLKQYAVFSGRARRKEYWMFVLLNFMIVAALMIILIFTIQTRWQVVGALLYWLYTLAIIIPSLAVSVRRLHDVGRSGWWILIDFVPLVGPILLIVFLATDSKPGDNKYGPNPKGIKAMAG